MADNPLSDPSPLSSDSSGGKLPSSDSLESDDPPFDVVDSEVVLLFELLCEIELVFDALCISEFECASLWDRELTTLLEYEKIAEYETSDDALALDTEKLNEADCGTD